MTSKLLKAVIDHCNYLSVHLTKVNNIVKGEGREMEMEDEA